MDVAASRCARASPSPPPAQTFCLPCRVILMSSPNTQPPVGWAGTSRCALQTSSPPVSSPPVSSPPLRPFYLEHPPLAEDRHRFLPGHALCSAPHKEFGCLSHQRCLSQLEAAAAHPSSTRLQQQEPEHGQRHPDTSHWCSEPGKIRQVPHWQGKHCLVCQEKPQHLCPGMDHPAWTCHSPATPG